MIEMNDIYLILACPPGSFFYNGSCYFYLPPKQIEDLKGIGFSDVSVDEGIEFYNIEKENLDSVQFEQINSQN
jgi:hypothetical protein